MPVGAGGALLGYLAVGTVPSICTLAVVAVDAVDAAAVAAIHTGTLVDVVLAVCSVPTGGALAAESVDAVDAAAVTTIRFLTFVNVNLTIVACEAADAVASVRANAIAATALVGTGFAGAVVNVILAVPPVPPSGADADAIVAISIAAVFSSARVHQILTMVTIKASFAGTAAGV